MCQRFQTSPLKPLGRLKPNFCGAFFGWGNESLFKWSKSRWQPCPYMVKIFKKVFSGTKRPMTLKADMQHRVLEYYQVCSNDDSGLTYFMAMSNFLPHAFVREEGKTIKFSETIVVYNIKVGRCSQLNEYLKLMSIKGCDHSLTSVQISQINIFNFFSSITTGPIEAKCHVEPHWGGGTNVCSNGPGHMTKIAVMPIDGKTFLKSSTLEPKGRWPWHLVCSIEFSSTTNFVQMMSLGWPWPILRQGQIWSPMLLCGKKLNNGFFRNYCSLWYNSW